MKRCLISLPIILSSQFFLLQAQILPYEPLRINEEISLDGKLDENVWRNTPVETEFMQADPNPGLKPTQYTEVRILYNDNYLYVGITCFDTNVDQLIQVELERDFDLGNDDGTAFMIDTYHDGITALNFVCNSLGARWDAQVTRDGAGLSDSYNTYWDAVSYVGDFGYSTEYRIPFSSLRFEEKEELIMGFRIARLIKRNNELITFPICDPNTSNAWTNVSYAREIIFKNLKSKNPIYISPYVIANYTEESFLNAAGSAYEKESNLMERKNFVQNETLDKILSNIGVDAKYGITKNLTLDLTLNTDFAQAEVDDRIINLSKYEVNLPEKRSFFLENSNYLGFGFPSGNELFISRKIGNENGTIVPIIGGARLTGKVNGWQMGFLNMQTLGIEEEGISPHNFFVGRTRKEFDALGSFIGGIITNRWNTDSTQVSNQSIGLDFVKRVNQQFAVEGGIASTMTDFKTTDFINSLYLHAGFFQSANSGFIYSGLLDLVGADVNPVMGYLDEQNYGDGSVELGYKYGLKEESKIQYLYLFTDYTYRWKLEEGLMETFEIDFWPGLQWKNGAELNFSLFEYKIDSLWFDWYIDDENAISSGMYSMLNNSIEFVAPQESNYFASIETSYGDFYGGKRFYFSPELTYYFNTHLNTTLNYEFNQISFDSYLDSIASTTYLSNLIRLNITYNINIKISIKAYIQFEDLSNIVSSNLRLRYNPKEGTDLFVVFNQGANTDLNRLDPKLPAIQNQALTIKFIKTFGS